MQSMIVQEVKKQGRVTRSPKHSFRISFKPFAIQPNLIAPVLPGETLDHALYQVLARTDGVKAEMSGWWFEQYVFYVKHRDLVQRDLITQMHLDPAANLATVKLGAADTSKYQFNGAIDWVGMCLQRVVEEYFRDEGEAWDSRMVGSLPMARLNSDIWTDSVMLDSEASTQSEELPGQVSVLPDQGIPAGFEAAYAHWESMRAMQLYTATFEDYLKSFGVSAPRETKVDEIYRPELIRYFRDWQLPSVKFDDSVGAAVPMVSWKMGERIDKPRFFAEPGFIFGVVVCRPKLIMANLKGAGVGMLDNAYAWLPAVLSDEPYTSLKKYVGATGPIANTGAAGVGDYWVDVKDLFIHGDQFYKSQSAEYDPVTVAPYVNTGKLDHRYYTGNTNTLFKVAAAEYIVADGVFDLNIKTRLTDTSL